MLKITWLSITIHRRFICFYTREFNKVIIVDYFNTIFSIYPIAYTRIDTDTDTDSPAQQQIKSDELNVAQTRKKETEAVWHFCCPFNFISMETNAQEKKMKPETWNVRLRVLKAQITPKIVHQTFKMGFSRLSI